MEKWDGTKSTGGNKFSDYFTVIANHYATEFFIVIIFLLLLFQ